MCPIHLSKNEAEVIHVIIGVMCMSSFLCIYAALSRCGIHHTGKMVDEYGLPRGQRSPSLHRAHTVCTLQKSA